MAVAAVEQVMSCGGRATAHDKPPVTLRPETQLETCLAMRSAPQDLNHTNALKTEES